MLKLYAWQDKFLHRICSKKSKELVLKNKIALLNGLIDALFELVSTLLPTIMFYSFIASGNKLDLATAVTCGVLLE